MLGRTAAGIVRTAGTVLRIPNQRRTGGRKRTRFRDNQVRLTREQKQRPAGRRTTLTLSPDAVEQFRVISNNMSAGSGVRGRGDRVITRGGTNTPHARVAWFFATTTSPPHQLRGAQRAKAGSNGPVGATFGGHHQGPTFFSFSTRVAAVTASSHRSTWKPGFPRFRAFARVQSIAARCSRIIPRSPIPRLLSWTPATRARRAGLRPPDAFRCGSAINAIPATPVDERIRWLDIPTTRQRHNLGPLQRKQPRPAAPRDKAARPSARTSPSAQNFSLTQPTSFPSVTTKCGWATTNSPQITTGTNPRSRRHITSAGRSPSYFSQTYGYVLPRLSPAQLPDLRRVSMTRGNHASRSAARSLVQENSEFAQFTNRW